MDTKLVDVSRVIENQRVGPFQILLGTVLLLTMFVDGFEAQAPGFAAPSIIRDFGVSRAAMTPIFVAGNFGLMIGAILLGILGDRAGRRQTIILGLLVLSLFSFLSTTADSIDELMIWRVFTGIGVGGILPSVIALGSEYSPKRYQATVIWFLLIGYQAGASSGAIVSTQLIPTYGWQVMFVVGAILPLLIGALVVALLPESVRFLSLNPASASRVIAILRRLAPSGQFAADARLVVHEEKKSGVKLVHLLADGRAPVTLLLWAVFIANLMALQFLLVWLPTVLESPSVPHEVAAIATVLVPAGGLVGGLVLSRFLDKGRIFPIAIGLALGVPMVALIGSSEHSTALLMLATFGAGCAIIGSQTNLHSIAGKFYPTFIRANGVGWANGVGRIGSVSGPAIGGALIALNLPNSQLFLFAAIPPFCAALACFALAAVQPRAKTVQDPDLAVQPGH